MLILVIVVMSTFLQMHDLSNLIMSIVYGALLVVVLQVEPVVLLASILARAVILASWLDDCVTALVRGAWYFI